MARLASSRSRRPTAWAICILIACGGTAGPASAGVLTVNPPPGHSVQDAGPSRVFSESYAVQSSVDQDAGCIVGFHNAPSTLSQEQLNARAGTPEFAREVALYIKLISGTVSTEKAEQQGVRGLTVQGDTNDREKETALATVFVTPKGWIVTSCLGPTARVDQLRPEFEAIVHGVVLPK